MDNKQKKHDFLSYINNPLSRESVLVLYAANNIKLEKCELYSDFSQSLIRMAFDTYLGDDVTDIEQQIKHFKWCWGKNIDNFSKEGLSFDNEKLYHYFLEFMLEVYYGLSNKEENTNTNKNTLKLWFNIFDYHKTKTNSDVDTLIEIYTLFNSALKIL
jgi:hypothetical protein